MVLISIREYFPAELKVLSKAAKNGFVVVPEGVKREVRRNSDLKGTLDTWDSKYGAVIWFKSNPRLREELVRMEALHGSEIVVGHVMRKGFWSSPRGRSAADGQVLAVTKVQNCVAVSNDEAVQNAALLEQVHFFNWQEFLRRLRHGLDAENTLFDDV